MGSAKFFTLEDVSRRDLWRDGEVRIISVTPVSRGVLRPFLLTVTTLALVVVAANRYHVIHRFEDWLILLLVGPLAVVTLTRTWRWRSHKVHVTSERVVIEGGVLTRQRTTVELRDVVSTRIEQRVHERLTRRGVVLLETMAGSVPVGLVRYPSALCRLIDAERLGGTPAYPLDTVFTFEEPEDHPLGVQADQWQRRRFE